jgi:hypothetical protein
MFRPEPVISAEGFRLAMVWFQSSLKQNARAPEIFDRLPSAITPYTQHSSYWAPELLAVYWLSNCSVQAGFSKVFLIVGRRIKCIWILMVGGSTMSAGPILTIVVLITAVATPCLHRAKKRTMPKL